MVSPFFLARSAPRSWGARSTPGSGPDLGERVVGTEVDGFDRHRLEVRVPVEAEQADGALGAVEQDQGDRVGTARPDGERDLDGPGELAHRGLLQEAQHLDVLPGAERSELAFEAPAQMREALRQVPIRKRAGEVERAGLALEERQVVERIEE